MRLTKTLVAIRRVAFGLSVFLILFVPVMMHSVLNIALSPVLSGSMRPAFNPGDLLITKEVPATELHVGDVVVLRNGNDYSLFSHRVVGINRTGSKIFITTRGDANPTTDMGKVEIYMNQTVPKGIGHIPWLGRVIVYFTNHKVSAIGDMLILLAAGYGLMRILTTRKKGAAATVEGQVTDAD